MVTGVALWKGKSGMDLDIQKASMWKRISAFLFDGIFLGILIVAFAYLLSALLGYDGYSQQLEEAYDRYETQYGIQFDISQEEYLTLPDEQQASYDEAYAALTADEAVLYTYNIVVNMTLLITTMGILLAYLVLEFLVPVLLGNGQTLGKKIFSIAVVRTDMVKANTLQLFARTLLGKFTVETMIPVYVLIMLYFNTVGIGGTLLLGVLLLVQIILLAVTRNRYVIHDLIAGTVVVDFASQRIFRSTEDLIAYKNEVHAQYVARQDY